MHELSIVEGILSIVRDAMQAQEGKRLLGVGLRVGPLAGVEPEILSFCFSTLVEQTPYAGATLSIEEVPVTGRCGACGARRTVKALDFLCEACGTPLSIEGGRELEISHIEVE